MYTSSLYRHSPVFVQNILVTTRSLARDALVRQKAYRRHLSTITETQWMNHKELRQFQNDQLYSMLVHCQRYIDFYKAFLPASLKPYRDDVFPLLNTLPKIDKHEVTHNTQRFVRPKFCPRLFHGSTSGSTGTPLEIYQDYNTIARESAFIARQMQWAGYRLREPHIWLRGDMIVPASSSSDPYWRMDYHRNTLVMSAYHISPQTCDAYITAIESFKPVLISAYPSAIGALAQYLDSHNRDIGCTTIRAIITSSETLTPHVQEIVEKRFGARIFDWYGSFERIAAIGTCEYGSLHVLTDYSFLEFTAVGVGSFKLCGSTFQNYTMPLLRYTMNDEFNGYSEEVSCKCGRHFPVVQRILGREEDYVYTRRGYAVSRLAHIFKGVSGILGAQLVQDRVGEVSIFVVPISAGPRQNYKELILRNAHQRLGADMEVAVQEVQALQKTANGKVKFVISNLEEKENNNVPYYHVGRIA